MHIQWYPGHMHKAHKALKKALPQVDLIIEILDARTPFSSKNPMLATLRGDKPCICILNKNDLADPEITPLWQTWFEEEQGIKTLALTSKQANKIRSVPDLCHKIVPVKKTGKNAIHTMIVGIPNVGKSTLINTLAGKAIAKTGNEPAITKRHQRINLENGIVLHDTPGVLWPNIENENSGYRLAATGAIRDTALEHDDVALFVADYLLQIYPSNLKTRYRLNQLPQGGLELLEAIGKKRGCLRSGGQLDLSKVSKILLTELRAGILGNISLETPVMMQQEIAKVALIRAQKAARR